MFAVRRGEAPVLRSRPEPGYLTFWCKASAARGYSASRRGGENGTGSRSPEIYVTHGPLSLSSCLDTALSTRVAAAGTEKKAFARQETQGAQAGIAAATQFICGMKCFPGQAKFSKNRGFSVFFSNSAIKSFFESVSISAERTGTAGSKRLNRLFWRWRCFSK